MTVSSLVERGLSNVEIARLLGVSERSVRYNSRRRAAGAVDGRSRKSFLADSFRPAIDQYLASVGDESPRKVTDLFIDRVAEHEYLGSLRNLQRFEKAVLSAPGVRTRRLVETAPGAKVHADSAHSPKVLIAGRRLELVGFSMQV